MGGTDAAARGLGFFTRDLAVDAGGAPSHVTRASCRRLLARAFKGARERFKAAKACKASSSRRMTR